MSEQRTPVFTIGHSNHSFEFFLSLLMQHEITALADVRSAPYSRFTPQFNRLELEQGIKAKGIKYVYLGRELGGRSDDRSCYDNGRIVYARLAKTSMFQSGIERLIKGVDSHRIALMCAEKEPLECHRTLLVSSILSRRGVLVEHILADGKLESHDASMERLLDVVGLPHQELFRSRDELISDALERQERRFGYFDQKLASVNGEVDEA